MCIVYRGLYFVNQWCSGKGGGGQVDNVRFENPINATACYLQYDIYGNDITKNVDRFCMPHTKKSFRLPMEV